MAEASYTDALYLVSRLGRGKQIVAINLTTHVSGTTTITTGFKRCVPVATPGAANALTSIVAAGGVITLTTTSAATAYNVLIVGDLY